MVGVSFGGVHSYERFGMFLLQESRITSPEAKTNYVDVPGADGALDLSEAVSGRPVYKMRTLNLVFASKDRSNTQLQRFSQMLNELHGKSTDIILDTDKSYFYTGRVSVGDLDAHSGYMTVPVKCTVYPYKHSIVKSDEGWLWDTLNFENGIIGETVYTVDGTLNVTVQNGKEPVSPALTFSAATTMTFKGSTYAFGSGTFSRPEIILDAGDNVMTFKGTGTVRISFREGRL